MKSVFLYFCVEGWAGQSKQFGRPGLVALCSYERFGQQEPFGLLEKPLAGMDSPVRIEPVLDNIQQPLIVETSGLCQPATAVGFRVEFQGEMQVGRLKRATFRVDHRSLNAML